MTSQGWAQYLWSVNPCNTEETWCIVWGSTARATKTHGSQQEFCEECVCDYKLGPCSLLELRPQAQSILVREEGLECVTVDQCRVQIGICVRACVCVCVCTHACVWWHIWHSNNKIWRPSNNGLCASAITREVLRLYPARFGGVVKAPLPASWYLVTVQPSSWCLVTVWPRCDHVCPIPRKF